MIRQIDPLVPFRAVRATRGKVARAEPVAALYEQGRVRICAGLGELEDQMCQMTAQGYQGQRPPDRVDALVWALTDLMVEPAAKLAPAAGADAVAVSCWAECPRRRRLTGKLVPPALDISSRKSFGQLMNRTAASRLRLRPAWPDDKGASEHGVRFPAARRSGGAGTEGLGHRAGGGLGADRAGWPGARATWCR